MPTAPSRATKPIFSVQVRQLIEFVLRRGDLGGGDFVGRNRALAGTRGHQQVQRSRAAGYQKELRLSYDMETDEFILRVQGRLDGLLVADQEVLLEEIKTVRRGWDGKADDLHWAQAKCYGFICARDRGLNRIRVQLTYLEIETGKLAEFQSEFSYQELSAFFTRTTDVYREWIAERHRWCQLRDASCRGLLFPFARYRPGQRELAVAAYRTMSQGGRLFLEAPTGIGKTMSVLFPAVKALGEAKVERIFYLTARGVGRRVAEMAFAELRRSGLRIRTLALMAREKLCVRDGSPCDPETCPFRQGYYDRFRNAMRQALGLEEITGTVLTEIGREHQVCPHELAHDLSLWVDAIICDYNYVFDPKAYLRRHFSEEQPGDDVFLVDEAHNLAERAREMFSAGLWLRDVQEVRRAIQHELPACARALGRVSSAIRKLCKPADGSEPPPEAELSNELELFSTGSAASPPGKGSDRHTEYYGVASCHTKTFPAELVSAVDHALEVAELWLSRNLPSAFRQDLLDLFFELHSFCRTAALYDERYVTITEKLASQRVRLFCLDPSFLVRQALARGKAAIFFSATLTPLEYYRALLGGNPEDPTLRLASPFPPENLAVLVHDRIQTKLSARAETLLDVVRAIGTVIETRAGNYLAFFPSYHYLEAAQKEFQRLYSNIPILVQGPAMTEAERIGFITAFSLEREKPLLGFAVMGGLFGEGIDLAGDRLLGAIVVGVGLPQVSLERDLIRDYYEAQSGSGFEYAYQFPGFNRVLQAAGRVIRSETDRGVVVLIDSRFTRPDYRRLWPPYWNIARASFSQSLLEALRRFWQRFPKPERE